MNVSLTSDLEWFIRAKVESGGYHSASEVVREALRLLEEHDRIRELGLEKLQREIQAGIDSGEPVDGEAVLDRLLARYEAMTTKFGS